MYISVKQVYSYLMCKPIVRAPNTRPSPGKLQCLLYCCGSVDVIHIPFTLFRLFPSTPDPVCTRYMLNPPLPTSQATVVPLVCPTTCILTWLLKSYWYVGRGLQDPGLSLGAPLGPYPLYSTTVTRSCSYT